MLSRQIERFRERGERREKIRKRYKESYIIIDKERKREIGGGGREEERERERKGDGSGGGRDGRRERKNRRVRERERVKVENSSRGLQETKLKNGGKSRRNTLNNKTVAPMDANNSTFTIPQLRTSGHVLSTAFNPLAFHLRVRG